MSIRPERIDEFRRLYKEGYGKEISIEEAEAMASRLVTLYKLLARPLPDEEPPAPKEPPQASV